MSWRESLRTLMRTGSFVSMVGGLISSAVYVVYTDSSRYPRMMATYSHGNILPPMAENTYETVYFPRLGLEQVLRRVLKPTFTNEYYLVNGDIGTGKTRTIVELTRELIATEGHKHHGAPVYVLASQGSSFAETLSKAVNFRFDEHISFRFFVDVLMRVHSIPLRDEANRLTRVLDAIEVSAFAYMQKKGRPVVIVVDSVNYLAHNHPGALEKLQEKAKLWADSNIVKLVLVNNDEDIEDKLQANSSSWARMATPIIVEDMSEDESLSFLTRCHFMEQDVRLAGREGIMDQERAQRIFGLVGGRILHLVTFRRDWLDGIPFNDTAEELKGREREKLLQVWRKSAEWQVLESILNAPGQTIHMSDLVCRGSFDIVHDLTRRNIIRYDRDAQRGVIVTFRSILAKNVIAEMQKMYATAASCDGVKHSHGTDTGHDHRSGGKTHH